MAFVDESPVYERLEIQQALGETLRPGGLDLTKRAIEFCALPAGSRMLDAGCGRGATVQFLCERGYRACGVDISATLLQMGARQNPALPLVQADGACLPLAQGQLEVVLAECSLSVFTEPNPVIAEFARLLSRNGYLILSDLYARNPAGLPALRALPPASCLCGTLHQIELLDMLSKHGFAVRMWEDHSDVLKRLAGQLAFTPAVLAQLSDRSAGEFDALDLQLAIARAKPGYFLLIAQKC